MPSSLLIVRLFLFAFIANMNGPALAYAAGINKPALFLVCTSSGYQSLGVDGEPVQADIGLEKDEHCLFCIQHSDDVLPFGACNPELDHSLTLLINELPSSLTSRIKPAVRANAPPFFL